MELIKHNIQQLCQIQLHILVYSKRKSAGGPDSLVGQTFIPVLVRECPFPASKYPV